MSESYIYHIIEESLWKQIKDQSHYRPESIENEGFIHFCERDQVETVLEFEEKPQNKLVALCVKSSEVNEDLQYENEFPHLYRPLKIVEVEKVVELDKLTE